MFAECAGAPHFTPERCPGQEDNSFFLDEVGGSSCSSVSLQSLKQATNWNTTHTQFKHLHVNFIHAQISKDRVKQTPPEDTSHHLLVEYMIEYIILSFSCVNVPTQRKPPVYLWLNSAFHLFVCHLNFQKRVWEWRRRKTKHNVNKTSPRLWTSVPISHVG